MGRIFRDLTDQKFGRLTVIKKTERKHGTNIIWKVKCDCGVEKEVSGEKLTMGFIKSCGCQRKPGITTCHPDRPHHAKGLCRECYGKQPWVMQKNCERSRIDSKKPDVIKRRLVRERSEKAKIRWIERHYKLNHDEAINIYNRRENGHCEICGKSSVKLHIDHSHGKGFVRGILCASCNLFLGMFEIRNIDAIQNYLAKRGKR